MYATLYDLFNDLFGVKIEFFKIIQMFGLFMAISFLIAYWVFSLELKRLEAEGKIHSFKKKVWEDKAPGTNDYILNFVFYFIAGFKIVEALFNFSDMTKDPQAFILSTRGNLLGGLLAGALGAYLVYREAQKVKGKTPRLVDKEVHPYQLMGTITFIAAISGLLGAKMFHILENMSQFYDDPWGSIFSFSGLTYYGGLICGAIAVLWYVKKYNIHWRYMLDAGGAGMMLSYAIGRVGCHVAGDGDWGIVNQNPKPKALSFLPDWMWSYTYPNNVNHECNPYTGEEALLHPCDFSETHQLIAPVYPTPIYETIMCLILFAIMWRFRKNLKWPGTVFCLYLVFAGIERFCIEKIRVNNIIDFYGIHATQAEIISVVMIIVGIAGAFYCIKKPVPAYLPTGT